MTNIGDIYKAIDVNGNNAPDLYKYLKLRKPGLRGQFITENFLIFICNRNGIPMERISSSLNVIDIEELIVKYL